MARSTVVLKLLSVLLLVAALASVSTAQDDDTHLIAQAQSVLKNFACPQGASTTACDTFRQMVTSGDKGIALQFSPLFANEKLFLGLVYVVFDTSSNSFWIISTQAARKENGMVLDIASYSHYLNGELRLGSMGHDIPVQNVTTFTDKDNGVAMSYFQDGTVSVSAQETTKRSNGALLTFTIQVNKTDPVGLPTADETITAQSGDLKVVHSGKALKFLSGNLKEF